MKRPLLLWREVLLDRGTWCCTDTTRDFETAASRFEHEGLSFLTITLPAYGKDLEKGLDQGKVDSSLFAGLSRKGCLPRFLGGFICRVFDRGTGLLLDSPDVAAIQAIRQLTLMFAKINLECSPERTKAALTGYVECEKELRRADSSRSEAEYAEFRSMSRLLLGDVLDEMNRNSGDPLFGWTPKHGPGQTAEKRLGNQKYYQTEWPNRLDQEFPFLGYLAPSDSYHEIVGDRVKFLEPGAERPVRVITVPKTQKTPRIIAIEPAAMQYTQQGVLEKFVEAISRHDTLGRIIGFDDQTVNNRMAAEGSITGALATLDLSEASDRVSNQLVRTMCEWYPDFGRVLDACRSRKAEVDGHGVLRLAKFASMGSALCFPVEASVFATVIFLGIQDVLSRPLTRRDIKRLSSQVRVYGDDIIVPVEYVHSVIARLTLYGFKVNGSKSFWTGKFRESCGKEYYDGEDVSIVRVRSLLPTSLKDVTEIVSTVSLRNQLYEAGYWRAVKWLDKELSSVIPMPLVSRDSSVLGRVSFLGYEVQRTEAGESMQRPLVRGAMLRTRFPRNSVDGHQALLKWFLKRGDEPFADRDHLERSGRPESVDIKIGWGQPFGGIPATQQLEQLRRGREDSFR